METLEITTLELLPRELKTIPLYNVRPYEGSLEEEEIEIAELAQSMEQDGQLEDLVIDQDHNVVCGHRRRRAAVLINERRSALHQPLFKLRCRIDTTGDLFRKAIVSNLRRKNYSPIAFAYLTKQIREKNGWDQLGGQAKVAAYLGVKAIYVSRHEKLLAAPKTLQDDLHSGRVSMRSAIDIMGRLENIPADKRGEAARSIIDRAAEAQQETQIDRAIQSVERGTLTNEEAARSLAPRDRVENPAISRVLRESDHVIPRNRKDIIELFSSLDGPRCTADGRNFLKMFLDEWVCGRQIEDDTIIKAWGRIGERR